jgi:hypothetical protein
VVPFCLPWMRQIFLRSWILGYPLIPWRQLEMAFFFFFFFFLWTEFPVCWMGADIALGGIVSGPEIWTLLGDTRP